MTFWCHAAVPDQEFRNRINGEKENHNEGIPMTGDGIPMTAEGLMLLADSKHKVQVESPKGWGIANRHEEKILAPTVKIARMEKLSKRKSNRISMKVFQNKGKEGSKKAASPKPAWTDKPPPKQELKIPFEPHAWKSKEWCHCDDLTGGKCKNREWRVHKATNCEGKTHVF
jgi:hypothetical protein